MITGVPASASRADVQDALAQWRGARKFAPPVGTTTTLTRVDPIAAAVGETVRWSELVPSERRLSLTVTPEAHAAITRGARRAGMTLNAYAVRELIRAASVHGEAGT